MTHVINKWQKPLHIKALQTSNVLQTQAFDIHPNQARPAQQRELKQHFKLPHTPVFLQQIHTAHVVEFTKPPAAHFVHQADACFTRSKDVLCAIMTADCLPVLMTDVAGSFIAAVHCGWRSLYAGILQKTLQQIEPENQVLVWFGPCIQQAQYEVGADFVTNYLKQHPTTEAAFTPIINGKSHASLYALATNQLQHSGVNHIESSNECTYLDPSYYSWRRNQTLHRMATMIWKTNE